MATNSKSAVESTPVSRRRGRKREMSNTTADTEVQIHIIWLVVFVHDKIEKMVGRQARWLVGWMGGGLCLLLH